MARPTRGGDNPAPPANPSPTPEELAQLLGRASRGDEQAWRELVHLYSRRIFALARSRLRDIDLAEEVTQSVFVTVANKLKDGASGYAEQGKFEPWLFRVAVNRIRDEVRRLKRQAVTVDDSHLENAVSTNGINGTTRPDDAALLALRGALALLTEADRQIIELRHHAGLSFAAMAEILDEPLGTLLARHHRALKKLKDLISNSTTPTVEEELA